MKALFTSALFLSITMTLPAFAFDIEPEYQGISETELERIESPIEIDSEYQSNVNSYTIAEYWNRLWMIAPIAADTSIGSLTNQHFLIYNRAKLQSDLSERLRFNFTYLSQQDREINQTRHVFELSQKLLSWLRINAYAEMAHYKRDNDLGFAILIEPLTNWTHRLYVTFHDFTRGNHNDQPDRFVGDDPQSSGWTTSFIDEKTMIRGGFRYDRSTKWNRPTEGFLFGYEKKLAFLDLSRGFDSSHRISLRTQWDSTFKGKSPLAGSSITSNSWLAERLLVRAAYSNGSDSDELTYEFALMHANRHWINQDGAHLYHVSFLPSLQTRLRISDADHIQVVIEATDFRKFGDLSLSPAFQKTTAQEARLQTAYEFSFQRNSRLLIAFNFDLDEWIQLPTFEGGNVQFRTEF